jgi:hypothetical protein
VGGFAAVTVAPRLIEIIRCLEKAGVPHLIMGGHAVRHYGVDRNTLDFDLHVSIDIRADFEERLRASDLASVSPLTEGPSWRRDQFRRFLLGRLDDGREEWLEFWFGNHLLPPFEELFGRSERSQIDGVTLNYLGLEDLIRSKETERESDWQDIALLEEIADARSFAHGEVTGDFLLSLSHVRSRKGFERLAATGALSVSAVGKALIRSAHPVTLAFLLPFVAKNDASEAIVRFPMLNAILDQSGGSPRHLALVEMMRRKYKQDAIGRDRSDKENKSQKGLI